jgi:hypothetical protein
LVGDDDYWRFQNELMENLSEAMSFKEQEDFGKRVCTWQEAEKAAAPT